MFQKITLSNGLRIITIPSKSSKTVTVLALVGVGSKYENKEINGISHYLEHMYFKGTKKRPNPKAVAETLDRIGGVYNAFTGDECTGYYAKVAASHFDDAIEWVSDIFLNSTLPQKEIIKEKGVIIEEINMIKDHPMNHVQRLWTDILYGDQPAGWNIAGTKETILSIGRKDLVDYMNKSYVGPNTIICVAGNVTADKVKKRVEGYFSKISSAEPMVKIKTVEEQKSPALIIENRNTDQTHICIGVRAYNIAHPHRYTLEVMETILGKMMSSRLFTKIREELGLAYYIRTDVEATSDTGFLVSQAGVDNTKVKDAISAILTEYKKIATRKVSSDELTKAKENIKGKMAISLESSDAQSMFYGMQDLLEKKIVKPNEIFKKIDAVTTGDILLVAKDIFRPENLNLALIGPSKESDIKKILII
ncbi:MAG: insulinase family protein [Candidatus Nealsonbacteria bacterium]|nr:insulinase family protein [Candidatus Nealsonbacteria bacterium]